MSGTVISKAHSWGGTGPRVEPATATALSGNAVTLLYSQTRTRQRRDTSVSSWQQRSQEHSN